VEQLVAAYRTARRLGARVLARQAVDALAGSASGRTGGSGGAPPPSTRTGA
jgi:hypothetical protein